MRTVVSSTNIVRLSVIRESKRAASSPFGPVRAGLTTSQITQDRQLTELLNSLERKVADLNYKSYTAYAILESGTRAMRVMHSVSVTEKGGTK